MKGNMEHDPFSEYSFVCFLRVIHIVYENLKLNEKARTQRPGYSGW